MRVILKVGRKIRGNTSNLIPGFEPDDNSIAIPKPLEGQSGCLILNNNAEGIGPGEPGGASSGARFWMLVTTRVLQLEKQIEFPKFLLHVDKISI